MFLTNTLEPVAPQKNAFLPQLSAEVEAAQAVKEKPILVILGNPPYSGHSKNKGKWITAAIDGYKHTVEQVQTKTDADGNPVFADVERPLGEKNPKWLNDDYVKFIRFAQLKMDAVEEGIVGIITNHSWLDNPTFRGMRQSLMRSFDQVFIVDLHGSTKPKEPAPEGVGNENVFDIQKGVAIVLFVKRNGAEKGIWHTDIWGTRLEKYQECADAELRKISWSSPEVFSPYFMFSPIDWTGWENYGEWWQVADSLNGQSDKRQIFTVNVLGFQTHRDHFAIAFTRDEMLRRVDDFLDVEMSDISVMEKFNLRNADGWTVAGARIALRRLSEPDASVINCAFRPFDDRSCFFGPGLMDRPRRELLDHVVGRDNLQLLVSRQIGIENWRHGFIASSPAESCLISDGSTEQNYCFPLRLFGTGLGGRENLSSDFRVYLDARYDHHYSPEEILGTIYAVLHAPTYRQRYAEFLRIDFPRIPFPEQAADFERLSKLGWALVQAHLMRDLPKRGLADYHGRGDNTVEHVRWPGEDQHVSINRTQSFAPVPEAVWNFHIGGYQVIDKYLKSRKGRKLSLDEINHVGRIADALAFTIDQMERIDAAYQQAFPDRG